MIKANVATIVSAVIVAVGPVLTWINLTAA